MEMDISNLSDYQLYELIQNPKMDAEVRRLANIEFDRRRLTLEQIQGIISKHDLQFKPEPAKGLKSEHKLLLILFPFLIPIQSVIAAKFLAKGEKKKWKDYWLYLCLGYLTWTILIITFFKLFVFTNRN